MIVLWDWCPRCWGVGEQFPAVICERCGGTGVVGNKTGEAQSGAEKVEVV